MKPKPKPRRYDHLLATITLKIDIDPYYFRRLEEPESQRLLGQGHDKDEQEESDNPLSKHGPYYLNIPPYQNK